MRFRAVVHVATTLSTLRVIPPVMVAHTRKIWVVVYDTFYASHKCELHGQDSYAESIREDSNLDVWSIVWSIVGFIVGIAGIIQAEVTNRRGKKQREELIEKFNHEREIDSQRYEEEKQRAIEAQKQADEDRQARQEQIAREETYREQQRLNKQREIEDERNYRESLRRFQRMDGARTRFDPKEAGWDARVTDDGANIEITKLTDKEYYLVIFEVVRPNDNYRTEPPFGEIRGLGSSGSVKISRFGGFDNVEAVLVQAYSNLSYPDQVTIPLDPNETMPEYRAA
ncbi:hypothetical protein FRC0036_02162 [Corynebacterium diphtheriae]|nr:hypothetical protein CDBH8_0699 [Corynebacterium diphtheriae BH8]AEX80634.1 hypothetical protein CDHC04_0641 [Corynebacterium diphtheriae HC04]MBG9277873.1 hypothetical protein [Corynebacterium diphtheriae bv. mitis]CAB0530664.1 hypothetical protein CIP101352_02336 [Corynebacterium diphtheriae]MBG9282289.1 hypothetical protein [Corynebacterium diphtheriae bv. mitis]